MTTDELYMRRCLQLAACGRQNAKPNPMVGAVIVAPSTLHPSRATLHDSPFTLHPSRATLHDSPFTIHPSPFTLHPSRFTIIGEGYHVRCGEGHAEVNAFASVKPDDEALLPQATMYVSLEPCAHWGRTPPCADLIINKGIARVVVGCIDEFAEVQGRGIGRLREAGIDVTVGVLEDECRALNRRFFTFHRLHRPYIILKWAQTANGFIDDHGQALAVSSPFTQMLSHKLRAGEDAILVGRVTDEREHPQLNVRCWAGQSPKRLVVDRRHPLRMESLYAQGIQSLIVEGGRKTLESFLVQDLWDEIRVETNTGLTVGGGTRAPQLPSKVRVIRREQYDANQIVYYGH